MGALSRHSMPRTEAEGSGAADSLQSESGMQPNRINASVDPSYTIQCRPATLPAPLPSAGLIVTTKIRPPVLLFFVDELHLLVPDVLEGSVVPALQAADVELRLAVAVVLNAVESRACGLRRA